MVLQQQIKVPDLSLCLDQLLLLKLKYINCVADIKDLTILVSNIRPNDDMAVHPQCVSTVWVHAADG